MASFDDDLAKLLAESGITSAKKPRAERHSDCVEGEEEIDYVLSKCPTCEQDLRPRKRGLSCTILGEREELLEAEREVIQHIRRNIGFAA